MKVYYNMASPGKTFAAETDHDGKAADGQVGADSHVNGLQDEVNAKNKISPEFYIFTGIINELNQLKFLRLKVISLEYPARIGPYRSRD